MPSDRVKAPLTAKQTNVYRFVADFVAVNGFAPSLRELMAGLHYTSPAPVQSLLTTLKNEGFLTWQPCKPRTICLLMTECGDRLPSRH